MIKKNEELNSLKMELTRCVFNNMFSDAALASMSLTLLQTALASDSELSDKDKYSHIELGTSETVTQEEYDRSGCVLGAASIPTHFCLTSLTQTPCVALEKIVDTINSVHRKLAMSGRQMVAGTLRLHMSGLPDIKLVLIYAHAKKKD
jgi:hypothetical protein